MPVPDIDFNQQAVQTLPTAQRKTNWKIFVQALISATDWLYKVFKSFRNGETLALYNPATTYAVGAKVQYGFSTYESLVAGNVGNTPATAPQYWILRNTYFIGAEERAMYTGQKLIFEYALNRYFRTTFRQPATGLTSDIFLETYLPNNLSFIMYPDSTSDKMYPTYSTGYMFPTPVYSIATTFKFNIHIPVAVYAALGPTADQIIRGVADKYAFVGTEYGIIQY
jgi:hypothetical protein